LLQISDEDVEREPLLLDQAFAASQLLELLIATNRAFRLGKDMEKRLHQMLHAMNTLKNRALRLPAATVVLAYCKGSSKAVSFVNSDIDSIAQHLASLCQSCVDGHDSFGFIRGAELALASYLSKKQALLLPNPEQFLSSRSSSMITPLAKTLVTVLGGHMHINLDEQAAKVLFVTFFSRPKYFSS
jgi:hypothetical protein